MLAAIFQRMIGGASPHTLPGALEIAIEAAFVFERSQPDPEARLARTWPELSPVARKRAAALICAKVAHANREAVRGARAARPSKFAAPAAPFDFGPIQ